MRILVTGASGSVGTNLCERLSSDHEVIAVSREGDETRPGSYGIDLNADMDRMAQIFRDHQPEAVIHLAAVVGRPCEDDPELARRINVDVTRQLGELAVSVGASHFIFFSTAAVYHQTELSPTSESSNISPRTVYGETKLAAEEALTEVAAHESQTQFITLRPFNIYGDNFPNSLVYKLIHSDSTNPVHLFGFNKLFRDYIHVDDVVAATELALDAQPTEPHAIMNIASGVATSNAQLVAALESAGHRPVYTHKECATLDISWADVSRAGEAIGFHPAPSEFDIQPQAA